MLSWRSALGFSPIAVLEVFSARIFLHLSDSIISPPSKAGGAIHISSTFPFASRDQREGLKMLCGAITTSSPWFPAKERPQIVPGFLEIHPLPPPAHSVL